MNENWEFKITHATKEEYLQAIKDGGQAIIDTAEDILGDFENDKSLIEEITISINVEPLKVRGIEVYKKYATKYKNKEEN